MATSVTLKPNAIDISGSTSGTTTLQASAVAGTTTLTLPAATDTLVGKATTDTLTNKTLTGAAMNGTLGATTPSTASVTTLTTSSTVTHSGGTANGVAYLDGSKVLTTGSALVFDGSNLGLGVTPSASWGSTWKGIQLKSSPNFLAGGTDLNILANAYYDGTNYKYLDSYAYASRYYQYNGQHQWHTTTSTQGAGNTISFTQAMTLDASGNLMVGTTTATSKVTVGGTSDVRVTINETSGSVRTDLYSQTGTGGVGTQSNHPFQLFTNGSERARIFSNGVFSVNSTSDYGAGMFQVSDAAGRWCATFAANNPSAGTYYHLNIKAGASNVGSITSNTTTTTYATSSDYRLKENVQPMVGALARVAALKPVTYKWNVDDTTGEGFIAHELAEVCPQAVVGEKDAVNAEGKPVYQGIDTSFLVATLTAAIQELKAEIDSLKSQLNGA